MAKEAEVDLPGLRNGLYFLRVVGSEEGGASEVKEITQI